MKNVLNSHKYMAVGLKDAFSWLSISCSRRKYCIVCIKVKEAEWGDSFFPPLIRHISFAGAAWFSVKKHRWDRGQP